MQASVGPTCPISVSRRGAVSVRDQTLNSKRDRTHRAYVRSDVMYADVAMGSEAEEDRTQGRVRSGWI